MQGVYEGSLRGLIADLEVGEGPVACARIATALMSAGLGGLAREFARAGVTAGGEDDAELVLRRAMGISGGNLGRRVPVSERVATLDRNLAAIAERGSGALSTLSDARDAWQQQRTDDGSGRCLFTSEAGTLVEVAADASGATPGRLIVWPGEVDAKALMPANDLAAEAASPPVVFVDGFSSPAVLRAAVLERFVESGVGASSRVFVFEPNTSRALDAMSACDLSRVLSESRVELFFGEHAAERLSERLVELGHLSLTGYVVTEPERAGDPEPRSDRTVVLTGVIDRARAAQASRQATLTDAVSRREVGRGVAYYARRFADAAAGDDALRVLVIGCRHSSYVGAASADLARSFESTGAESRVLIEPDAHSTLTSIAALEAVMRFDPDLIVTVNYPREVIRLGLPAGVPLLCWIQDPMPHLFEAGLYGPEKLADFYAGHEYKELRRLGLPADRLLVCPVLASDRSFSGDHGWASDDVDACDVAFVTNHGEPPAALLARLCDSAGIDAAGRRHLAGFLREASLLAKSSLSVSVRKVADRVSDAMAAHVCGAAAERGDIAEAAGRLRRHVVVPVLDRMLRHATARWAVSMAEDTGVRLNIIGRGWDEAPGFEKYARGAVEHGESLRRVYASAGVTLHASAAFPLHQRLLEIALSGGLPGVLLKLDDLWMLQQMAGAHASRDVGATMSRVGSRVGLIDAGANGGRGVLPAVTMQLQRVSEWLPVDYGRAQGSGVRVDEIERLPGLAPGGFWGLYPAAGRVEGGRSPRVAGVSEEMGLLGDWSAIGFHDAATLCALIECARERRAWRADVSAGIRARVRRSFTYERAARAIVSFVGDGLAREAWGNGAVTVRAGAAGREVAA